MPVPHILASVALPPVVLDIGACLITAGLLAVIFTRFKIPTIAAFLLAGVIVGPIAGKFVTDAESIRTIAELGLILLLFVIGCEIDLKKLVASGRVLILSGLLQFPLCIAFGIGVTLLARTTGWGPLQGRYVPLYVGVTAAASSTLIVVKLLQARFQLDTIVGRVALGILIFQDIWAIVLLAVQPNLANPAVMPILQNIAGIVVVAGIAALLARFFLPHAFRWVARSPELMLLTAVAWCFGLGYAGAGIDRMLAAIGISGTHFAVSEAMGALIAGATVATLPYAHDVIGKVGIVKDFFVTLFFVALGMGIPMPHGVGALVLAVFLVLVTLASRYFVFFPLLYWTGLDRRSAVTAATKLAPISEFCLVICYLGMSLGHITAEFQGSVIFAFVISALAAPFLFELGNPLHDRFGPFLSKLGFKLPAIAPKDTVDGEEYLLAILGFHRVASSLLHELGHDHPELLKRTLVVDFNAGIHADIAKLGPVVKYGDFSNVDSLHHLGIDRAKVILCTIPDDLLKGTSNLKLLETLQHLNHDAIKIVTATDFASASAMYSKGAGWVILPRVEVARSLMPVLEAAMAGNLAGIRESALAADVPLAERREVFR